MTNFYFLATLAVRLIMFPVIVKAQRNMIKLNHNQPEMQKYQYAVQKAKTRKEGKKLKKATKLM